jgi:hypothetical protein
LISTGCIQRGRYRGLTPVDLRLIIRIESCWRRGIVTIPHPRKELPLKTALSVLKQAGLEGGGRNGEKG